MGCLLCGKAMGLRWEECYINEDTKAKLLAHSQELERRGITVEQEHPHRKNADTTLAVIALVLGVADSLDHGVLRELVIYLHRELMIPRDEIIRLRLSEPEEVDEALHEKK
jgi:hypothetical protein